ncbi:adenosylmethionine decarboxylase [Candidatus Neomarinimicrobiota bacterium]
MLARDYFPHLLLDLENCNSDDLGDQKFVSDLLSNIAKQIGMRIILGPHVIAYNGQELEAQGITGFLVLAESHISIHTFSNVGYVYLDIFSCKQFDVEKAKAFIINALKPDKYHEDIKFRQSIYS